MSLPATEFKLFLFDILLAFPESAAQSTLKKIVEHAIWHPASAEPSQQFVRTARILLKVHQRNNQGNNLYL
jgi:hypothetical protein